jgi:AcrR family transcriptional regulator
MPGKKASEETRREDILRAAYDVAARQGLEALTLRAVATRADVSHGTVIFHFKRQRELVAALLDRVVYATAVLRIPDEVMQITRPSDRLHAVLRAEMDRLSTEPRHFACCSITGRSASGTPRSVRRFGRRSSSIVRGSATSPMRSSPASTGRLGAARRRVEQGPP